MRREDAGGLPSETAVEGLASRKRRTLARRQQVRDLMKLGRGDEVRSEEPVDLIYRITPVSRDTDA